jgi:hypothetical protein
MFAVAAGPVLGLIGGLGFGLTAIFSSVFETPIAMTAAVSASGSLATDRNNTARKIFAVGPTAGFLAGTIAGSTEGLQAGLVIGPLIGVVVGLTFAVQSAWGVWLVLSRIWLPLTGRLPWPIVAFLADAHHRGVLRQAGAVYQFRHVRLQDYLTQQVVANPSRRPNAAAAEPLLPTSRTGDGNDSATVRPAER